MTKRFVQKNLNTDNNILFNKSSVIFPVTGIGVTAKGLDACIDFVKNLSTGLQTAYVIVHQIPHTEEKILTFLQKCTSIPVSITAPEMPLEQNHLYIVPVNTFINIHGNVFNYEQPEDAATTDDPIDHFFTQLAVSHQSYAIGMLLSEITNSGLSGLHTIKTAGGITFVQDDTANTPAMLRYVRESRYADFILPPGQIALELETLLKNTYPEAEFYNVFDEYEEELKKILNIISRKHGIDFFNNYKRTTIHRRILRRMVLNKFKDLRDYARFIATENTEAEALFEDFLIGVTSFFREPDFYHTLTERVLPEIIKRSNQNDPIRIWISGCATGEETYSIAICLLEFLESNNIRKQVQLFSTDLNKRSIQRARAGIYSRNELHNVSLQRLKQFFVKKGKGYQITKQVRDICTFAVHNLLQDPPFSRIDLISCQNVLIYLEQEPQKRIMQTFHYALKPLGHLFLGRAESITNIDELFECIEKEFRVYIKRTVAVPPSLDFSMRPHATSPDNKRELLTGEVGEFDIDRETDKILLKNYVPPALLVSRHMEILLFRGLISPYLEPSPGRASLNLLKMIRDDLSFELKNLIHQAMRGEKLAVKHNIAITIHGNVHRISIEVLPVRTSLQLYFLIVFKDEAEIIIEKKASTIQAEAIETQNRSSEKLERELYEYQQQMKISSEEFESIRKELQSANEEILSSNEELQSINEELETSKEELQSANEELMITNKELQKKNTELKESRDYSEAIIHTMRGPLIVLTADMNIRTANRAFYDTFRLTRTETEGHSVLRLGHNKWMAPVLREKIQEVFSHEAELHDFEINHSFPRIGYRTMLVNASKLEQGEKGDALILLVFEDITERRQAEQGLVHAQEQLKMALISGSVSTWLWNIKTNEIKWSKEESFLYGLPEVSYNGTFSDWQKSIHPDDLTVTLKAIRESIEQKKDLNIEFRIVWPDKSIHWILARAKTYSDHTGTPERMAGVHIDITSHKRTQQALLESEKRFQNMSDNAPVMIWMAGVKREYIFFNRTWLSFTGRTTQQELNSGWTECIHTDDRQKYLEVYNSSFEEKKEFKVEYRLKRFDDEYRWVLNHGIPRFTTDKTFTGYIGTCIDITDRIELEKQKDDFIGIASHELKTPVTSIKAYGQILHEKFSKSDDSQTLELLSRMNTQVDRLTRLITTLLDVSKIESKRFDYTASYFKINEFVLEVIEELQYTTQHHMLIPQLDADIHVYGDRERLAQVLINLVSNAIKYSPGANKVIISTKIEEENIIVSVEDFGIGIPRDFLDKVFGRFFRVSASPSKRITGLGLGLYIAAEIIKQHNGKIWVESKPGEGSTFYFSLPLHIKT